MRATWTGQISFSFVTIPIQFYPAVDKEEAEVSFKQLHREDYGAVGYEKKCKKCGKVLSGAEIVKGYAYDEDQYALIEEEELKALRLPSTKTLEIEAFVAADDLALALFDRPFLVGPGSKAATKAYELLRRAMAEEDMLGVGRVVMHGRERIVALRPDGDGMMAYELRYPNELRAPGDAPYIEGDTDVKADELKLAKQLVETMTQPFGALELKDRYREAVAELVNAKVEGREVATVEEAAAPAKAPTDLMSALRESLDAAKAQRKPMAKAGTAPATKAGAKKAGAKKTAAKKTAAKSAAKKPAARAAGGRKAA